ncbi:DUF3994 domain-containing protein [Bacillus sp. S10(2024)]|uniref:DUF3994 domain-containing protein n=2 Tax=Bacillus TaxID=1386 RepID=UPI003D2345AA
MKRKLLAVALPVMMLGGCAVVTLDKKEDTKVQSKEKVETKEKAEPKKKLEKKEYIKEISFLEDQLETKIGEITQIAGKTKDKTNDIKELNKEMIEKEKEIQETIAKFDRIEPPKDLEDAHKTILKAVDCYSKAFANIVKLEKTGSLTKKASEDSKELVLKGNDLLQEGFKPIKKAQLDAIESVPVEPTDYVKSLKDGKDLVGEWGTYQGSEFRKGIDFKEDGTYIAYDDSGKTSYDENHMLGTWSYKADTKQVNLTAKEFVKDGKKLDTTSSVMSVDYTVTYFEADKLSMKEPKGTGFSVMRRK